MKMMTNFALAPLPLALALTLGYGPVAVYAAPQGAQAAQQQRFAVPAGKLDAMLLAIASNSGRAISFDPALISSYQGSAVQGTMTVEQAVAASLVGTDLALDVTSNGTLTVVQRPEAPQPVAANMGADDAQLPEIAVTGAALSEDQLYYNPSNSSTVTRSDTPIKEIPQSIEVISSKVLRDRQATDLAEAVKGSAGVSQTLSNRGEMTFKIRGFAVQQTSTNGVTNPSVIGSAIEGVERIEVIKGPDSVMSGSSSPGGTINLVRKAPVVEPLRQLTLEMTDETEFKQAIDLGGALNDDRSLSYRLNVMNLKSDRTEPDFDGDREVYVAPVIRWDGERTHLTLGAEYDKARSAAPRTTIALNGKIQHLPSARLFRRDEGFRSENKTAYYEFSQDLFENWSFNSKATYLTKEDNLRVNQIAAYQPNGSVAFASPFSADIDLDSWSLQNDVRGKFTTGFVTHKVMAGVDYQHYETTQWERSVAGESRPFPDVNAFDPHSYDRLPAVGDPTYKSQESRLQQRGLLLQYQADLWERVHVLLATKKAKWLSDGKAYRPNGQLVSNYSMEAEKWVPNYGLAVDITPDITVYANLMHGFTGSGSINRLTGEALSPLTSKNKEIGFKFNLLDDSLTLTTAYFELEQDNVPLYDSLNGNVLGTQSRKSEGFDLNLTGEILPGWNVSGSYSKIRYIQEEPTRRNSSPFIGEPEQSFNLWTSYEFQDGALQGFGAGVGVDAYSDMEGGVVGNSYALPGGASTDVSVFYHGRDYSITLGVKNVFDRDLYSYSSTPAFVPMQDNRNARLTFVYNF